MSISPAWRQLLVAGSTQLAALSVGGAVGYPSVLLYQLGANDTSITLDLDTGSWIGSLHGLAGIPSILMPAIMQWKGRKFAFIAACLLILTGWILTYTATDILHILLSECFHGLGTNSILAVSMLSMGEMVDPKYRNTSLLSFSILQTLGMAVVGILARYLYWKTISVIMSVPIFLALLIACLWPESPSWLAFKGKFDKCETAFRWLRGTDDMSKKELEELINAQKEILGGERRKNSSISINNFFRTITSEDFYVPGIHMFILLNLMYWSGVMVVLIYSIELIQKVTLNENAATNGGIAISSILFICQSITGVLIRYFDNKSVLLLSTLGTVGCLLSTSVVTYMQGSGSLPKESMVCLYCLIAYTVCSSLGLSSIIFTMAAELMPVKHRGFGGALYVIFTCVLHTSSLKTSPYLFIYIGMWGTFLVYAINATLCGLFVWKFVPETKGRTLQEIEDYYNYGKFVKRRNRDKENVIDNKQRMA